MPCRIVEIHCGVSQGSNLGPLIFNLYINDLPNCLQTIYLVHISFSLTYYSHATRITHHSETLIDNIFLNSIEHFTISGNLVYDLADHLPNFLIIKKFSSLPTNVKIFKRDYSNFDETALVNDIQAIDWWQVFSGNTNTNDMFDSFYETVEMVDAHIPIKQTSKRQLKCQSKPWITPAIKTSIKKKNDIYKKFPVLSFEI